MDHKDRELGALRLPFGLWKRCELPLDILLELRDGVAGTASGHNLGRVMTEFPYWSVLRESSTSSYAKRRH